MARTITNVPQLRSRRTLLFLAVAFAVVAAVLVFVALSESDGEGKEEVAAASTTSSVVVASKDIPARTELTARLLEVTDLPPEQVLRGAFGDAEPLVGQVTRYPLAEGEQVTLSKVGAQTTEEEEPGLSFVIPQGMRAFSIQVSEVSSVGGLVLPGDLIDIIAILDEGDVDFDKAVTLLQNIEVLAVAQTAQEAIPPQATVEGEDEAEADGAAAGTEEVAATRGLGLRPEDAEANPKARTVTLAVTPQQAQLLALTQARGKLALSLRSYGDEAEVQLGESTLAPWGGSPRP